MKTCVQPPVGKVVFLRHGQSVCNEMEAYTGWEDCNLTSKGEHQAVEAGRYLKQQGYKFDVVFTSVLSRALDSAEKVCKESENLSAPVVKSWRLNARHPGVLQGLTEGEAIKTYGNDTVRRWRGSFDEMPECVPLNDPRHPANSPLYAGVPKDDLPPGGESLARVADRMVPFWKHSVQPRVQAGETVLIVGHKNSLRALFMYLEDVPESDMFEVQPVSATSPLILEFGESSLSRGLTVSSKYFSRDKAMDLLLPNCLSIEPIPELGNAEEENELHSVKGSGLVSTVLKEVILSTPRAPRVPSKVSIGSVTSAKRWNMTCETLIFVDWDDTLCPSTWLCDRGCRLNDSDEQLLRTHQVAIISFLRVAAESGCVVVLTMALIKWVDKCKELMPAVAETLKELNITIVSARESQPRYLMRSASNDRDPSQYLKTQAMRRVTKRFYKQPHSWKNIVSIGDSEAERNALQDLVISRQQRDRRGNWQDCRCKTLLLIAEPSVEVLGKELQIMKAALPKFAHYDGDLHLKVEVGGSENEVRLELNSSYLQMPEEFNLLRV